MLKKLVYALALTGLASGQAFALTNAGFESGNASGWTPTIPTNGLTVVGYGTPGATIDVIDDAYTPVDPATGLPIPTSIYKPTIDAFPTAGLPGTVGAGNYFGLLETCPAGTAALSCSSSTTYSFNLSGPVSAYGDFFLARLFTADYLHNYNDTLTITYSGASMTSISDTISVRSMNPGQDSAIADSGWIAFAVPVGTQNIFVKLDNVSVIPFNGSPTDKLFNRPIAAIDYAAAVSPVPEAGTTAMMLAGLGVMGLVSRRRAKRVA